MYTTIQNNKNPTKEINGRYYQTFIAQNPQELIKIHHMGCIGDTELKNIQIEKGTKPTEYAAATETTPPLSGLFNDFRNLKLDLLNESSTLRASFQTSAKNQMVEYFDTNVKSEIKQSANQIRQTVSGLMNDAVMKSDIKITPSGIQLGSGKVVNGATISSLFVTNPESIKAITRLMEVSGDLLVNGSITTNKLASNSITAALLKAASVESKHLVSEAVEAKHLKVDEALFNKLLANEVFVNKLTAKKAFINHLSSIKIEANQIQTDTLKTYTGFIGGFRIGNHPNGWGSFLTGTNDFSVGMSDGYGKNEGQAALWVNWKSNWQTIPNEVWYVAQNGKMFAYAGSNFKGDVSIASNMYIEPSGGEFYYKGNKLNDLLNQKMNMTNVQFVERKQDANGAYIVFYSNAGNTFARTSPWSDRKLKSNIVTSQVDALDAINKLQVYEYDFKKDSTEYHKSIGLIAQEIGQYLPDAHETFDGIETYNPFFFVPYLVKAIQQLSKKVEQLERKLSNE